MSIYDSVFYLSKNLVVAGNVNSSGIIHYVDDLFFWTANLIRGSGAIMSITLIPTVPMANIEQSAFAQVVEKCQMINAMGVAVMLNFAPSMNGNWYPYGQSPRAYLQAFQLLSNLVQNGTNQTAMVWSPSAQLGYPFVGGRYSSNSSEIRSLDTNGNGLLDGGDDPYLPYYPGDKFVDWVGFSAYYTSPPGNSTIYPILSDYESQLSQETSLPTTTSPLTPVPTLAPFVNVDPRNQSVADQPTFESLLTSPRTNFNLYRDFSLARRKPFVVSSTGAGFYAGNGDVTELQVKSSWYGQIFNSTLLTNYEYIRAIVVQNNVFSLANTNLGVGLYKPSNLVNTVSLDFSISNPAVRQSFTALVSTLINQKMVSNRTRIASS